MLMALIYTKLPLVAGPLSARGSRGKNLMPGIQQAVKNMTLNGKPRDKLQVHFRGWQINGSAICICTAHRYRIVVG